MLLRSIPPTDIAAGLCDEQGHLADLPHDHLSSLDPTADVNKILPCDIDELSDIAEREQHNDASPTTSHDDNSPGLGPQALEEEHQSVAVMDGLQ